MGSKGNFSVFDLWDTYLPPYEAAFIQGAAAGHMCSYISMSVTRGGEGGPPYVPSCASSYLMQRVVREYWARPDAYALSDCGAVYNMYKENHYVKSFAEAAGAALSAGMDINSNTILPEYLPAALARNLTTEAALDASLRRSLAWRLRLGMLDPLENQRYAKIGAAALGTPASREAAAEGAAQGLVLVQNSGVLPLAPGLRLAVVGPMATTRDGLLGDYYGCVCRDFLHRAGSAASS